MYCGAPVAGVSPASGPVSIASPEDLIRLLKQATDFAVAGNGPAAEALTASILLALSFKDVKDLFNMALDAWLKSVEGRFPGPAREELRALMLEALMLASFEHYQGAFDHALKALQKVGLQTDQHHLLPLLCVGFKGAAVRRKDEPVDDCTRLERSGAELLATPGKLDDGVAVLTQALALVPDPPVNEKDKARRERLLRVVAIRKKQAAAPPTAPTAAPTSGVLMTEGFDAALEDWGKGKA